MSRIALREPPHDVGLDRTSAARRLEIDDVQTRAARDVERIEHRFRLTVHARRCELAVREAHDASVQQVEGRDQLHAMKFLSTRRPAVDDFSG